MTQQVQAVELVLPPGSQPPSPPSTGASSWWVAAFVALVLVVNALLVWYRLKGRDPLKRAFAGLASRLGLNRAERERLERIAGANMAPVALLISESALERASRAEPDDPLIVSVRHKVRNARA